MPQSIKDVQWSDCMWLAGIFSSLCWHASALVMLPSPLTRSGKVRQWLWIKASQSNELITGGNAFSTEMKALFYYVSYADKKSHYEGFHRGLFNTVLKHNYLLRVISIANWGWWTLIGYLTYNSKSIGLLARERVQNANYLIINI